MTSSIDLITAWKSAVTYLYQFGGPVFILMGTIGSILNLIVFTQKTLRKNPCSVYFIPYNLANFFYIYSSLLPVTLNAYQIDSGKQNLSICRLCLYITILFNCLSPFYLILASIDRILVTSPNALTRQRSTFRLAYTCIVSGTVFWVLFHSHALLLTNIIEVAPNIFICYYQPGVYLTFISYYSIIKEIVALSLMIICGSWAVKNIQNIRRVRPAPILPIGRTAVGGHSQFTSSKDRQLISMLCLDITIYGLFSFVFAIFLIYQQITQDYQKSSARIEIEVVIRNVCLFSTDIPYCTSCYTNLIASKTFRKRVKKILSFKRLFCIV